MVGAMSAPGIVYVLTNPSLPGIVKIGRTNDLTRRAKELRATGLPHAFTIAGFFHVPDAQEGERRAHSALAAHRYGDAYTNGKMPEHFQIDAAHAVAVLSSILGPDAQAAQAAREAEWAIQAAAKREAKRAAFWAEDARRQTQAAAAAALNEIAERRTREDGREHNIIAGVLCILMLLLVFITPAHAATNARNERTAATYRAEGVRAFRESAAARKLKRAEVRRNRATTK